MGMKELESNIFNISFCCLRLQSGIIIEKYKTVNRHVRKAWNPAVARSIVEVFELTRLSKRATKTPRRMYIVSYLP